MESGRQPGAIKCLKTWNHQRIWVTISQRDPVMLRVLIIWMYWDGNTILAIDVPFRDLFWASTGTPTAFSQRLFQDVKEMQARGIAIIPVSIGDL